MSQLMGAQNKVCVCGGVNPPGGGLRRGYGKKG